MVFGSTSTKEAKESCLDYRGESESFILMLDESVSYSVIAEKFRIGIQRVQ